MSKRIIRCQVWEWYGSEDFTEGRYKPKGSQEFVYEATPESESFTEDELIDKWDEDFNRHGQWFRYEARSIDYYWEPLPVEYVNEKFLRLNIN